MTSTYKDVKTDILAKIVRGDWQPGCLLPNEVDLAETYGCARATVNRAMRELAQDGIVERRRKAGTRVRLAPVRQARFDIPVVRGEIEGRGETYRYALVSRDVCGAPDWLRARLDLAPPDRVLHLTCMHYANGAPYQFEDRWINLGLLPQAEQVEFVQQGPNEWLIATIPFSNVEIGLSAVQATAELADHLGCAPGDALFQTERATWWKGRAVTFVRLCHRPGHCMTTRY